MEMKEESIWGRVGVHGETESIGGREGCGQHVLYERRTNEEKETNFLKIFKHCLPTLKQFFQDISAKISFLKMLKLFLSRTVKKSLSPIS